VIADEDVIGKNSDKDATVLVYVEVGLGGRGVKSEGEKNALVLSKPEVRALLDTLERLVETEHMPLDSEPIRHLDVDDGIDVLLGEGLSWSLLGYLDGGDRPPLVLRTSTG